MDRLPHRLSVPLVVAALLPGLVGCGAQLPTPDPDPQLVSITSVAPTVTVESRYAGPDNFVGEPIRGYQAPACLLTPPAAAAVAAVQQDLAPFGLSLRTYDCFRPQRAVDHFVAWAKDLSDTRTKARFYPDVDKADLFRDGYIAERSGHSRGSTVDLTIDGLDMGTPFDFFDPLSHTANPTVGPEAQRNRLLLKTIMDRHGFQNLPEEWWHFTLRDEPYPDTYFDIEVR